MRYEAEIRDILFLTYLTGYNIKDIHNILEGKYINSVENYFLSLSEAVQPVTKFNEKSLSVAIKNANEDTNIAIEYLKYYNIKAIPYFSKEYPEAIKQLKDYPPLLFVKGRLKKIPLAAIVGTRNVSVHAERITCRITDALIDKGYGIVSGLAHGIDSLAHKRSLYKNAYTIAVMPNSLDSVYPKENIGLANEILKGGGALVSELINGINRGRKSFVERNRLQVAFAELTVPIEMNTKSGTMHTVNFTKRQNKLLFLLNPSDRLAILPQYEGIVELINQQKNSPKKNVFIVNNMDDFNEQLNKYGKKNSIQIKLFEEKEDSKNEPFG